MRFILLVLQYLLTQVWGLIGYDCGSKLLNITTLSLIDVGECSFPDDTVKVEKQYIQLLQLNDFTETEVIQCKLEIHRTVYYCGMHSHISIVRNGENEYIYETSARACEIMHTTGVLRFGFANVIQGLRLNETITHSLTFAGSLNNEGRCSGVVYSDPYGTWESVVVQGTMKITLMTQQARVSLQDDQIHLRSGTVCPLSSGTCIDMEGGYTFWKPMPIDNCKFNRYGVLYEGVADKLIDNQTVYSLATQDITFALTAKNEENVCGYKIIRTEHPKLFIFETSKGSTFAHSQKTSVANLDIFAYINSKFIYVEKHIRTQLKYLYRDVVYQRCNLERETLKNSLTIATQAPDEFAFNLMKGPGYMAVVAGEVVHIVKCIPVEVIIEHGENCYTELQVSRENTTYYLTPRTHILKRKGTQISCNALLPVYYFISDAWYKLLPRPVESKDPAIIRPMTRPTWKYQAPAELATSGIYTSNDLKELRKRIMFPVEHPAVLNNFAREVDGYPAVDNEGTIMKLLNDEAVSKIIETTWDKTWKRFMAFGTASAGLIAIIIIIKVIKAVIDILVRGYALHSAFGWSFHILGAIWSSIAHLLLFLSQGPPPVVQPNTTPNTPSTAPVAPVIIEMETIPQNNDTSNQTLKENPVKTSVSSVQYVKYPDLN